MIILIGSGTGGLQVLPRIVSGLTALDASLIIVQHMPGSINEAIRQRIAEASDMPVKLGQDGDCLEKATIYIAPSDVHMKIRDNRSIELADGPKINHVRPAIDVAMKSLLRTPTIDTIGILLTGMGSDGMKGISHIKSIGGATIAQSEASCVISDMPKSAIGTGAVDYVLPPEDISARIVQLASQLKPIAAYI